MIREKEMTLENKNEAIRRFCEEVGFIHEVVFNSDKIIKGYYFNNDAKFKSQLISVTLEGAKSKIENYMRSGNI